MYPLWQEYLAIDPTVKPENSTIPAREWRNEPIGGGLVTRAGFSFGHSKKNQTEQNSKLKKKN